ncbi:Uncharacterized protein dnl_41650 [Desulfonema limicola]|uniref:Uncharacterized protein n=1 Tax=Desulfonema limicola TaxID=45656 RepID=A0A975BA33_9BACT|nr:Uncharacterized protein dnl_41650 [Desulfonema limicola]
MLIEPVRIAAPESLIFKANFENFYIKIQMQTNSIKNK